MPTYEYKCKCCNLAFEEFQKMTDEPINKCPECEGEVQRLISKGTGFILKGAGFYSTDYKNKECTKKEVTEQKCSDCKLPEKKESVTHDSDCSK